MIQTFPDDLRDHRRSQGQRYELKFIVLFTIMAFLSNAKSYRDISRFFVNNFHILQKEFRLKWKKTPGYTTIRNIIIGINGEELEACFRAYTQSLLKNADDKNLVTIAIDGKTLCGSYDHFIDKRPIQIVNMFKTDNKIILAHEVIEEKTNEIPVVQKLLRELELEDYLFTIDALHCQKQTFEAAKESGKNIIVQLKDNQKELVRNCEDIKRFTKPIDDYREDNVERNRIEYREIRSYHDNGFIEDKEWKEHIKTIFFVDRNIQKMNTKIKQYEESNETAIYVTNKVLTAKQAFHSVRKHWLIENSNHYVRDVSMLEDLSRIRVKSDIIARLRSFALNIMRNNNVINIKGEMYENSLCYNRLYSYKQFI